MTGKPAGPAGQFCQLARRNCDHPKACQSCFFWREMDVTRGGKMKTEWDCALAWPVMIGGVANARLDALTVSTQEMRNEFNAMKEAMGHLVMQIAAARNRLPVPPTAPMRLVGDSKGDPYQPPQRDPMLPPYDITSRALKIEHENGQVERSNQS